MIINPLVLWDWHINFSSTLVYSLQYCVEWSLSHCNLNKLRIYQEWSTLSQIYMPKLWRFFSSCPQNTQWKGTFTSVLENTQTLNYFSHKQQSTVWSFNFMMDVHTFQQTFSFQVCKSLNDYQRWCIWEKTEFGCFFLYFLNYRTKLILRYKVI